MIEKNLCGKFPKCVYSLPECMKIFLGIPPTAMQCNNDNTVMWIKHPLSQSLKSAAAKYAIVAYCTSTWATRLVSRH
jgi:hypothetical protein